MMKPDLKNLSKWIGEDILGALCRKRKNSGAIKRERKLGTSETLLICLGVAIHSERYSLHDILRDIATGIRLEWAVSAPGFCKARARFSPGVFSFRLRAPCR